MERLSGLIGFVGLLGVAFALSSHQKAIHYRTVFWGISLQVLFAFMVLKGEWLSSLLAWIPLGFWLFSGLVALQAVLLYFLNKRANSSSSPFLNGFAWILGVEILIILLRFNLVARFFILMRDVVNGLISYANEGAQFVFGPLAQASGAKSLGIIFAFQVLPTIIFVASIFAILYYFGFMQLIVNLAARLMRRFMKVSGAESVSVAASILMGQTEAPLTIRPYLAEMTRSELMTIMTAGMAHVSGGIMAAYVLVAHVDVVHLLTAVVMTAPGAVMISKILVPETETPKTSGEIVVRPPCTDVNMIDAAARGASEGLHLAFNVAGMLVAFIALVALVNGLLGALQGGLAAMPQNWPAMAGFFQTLAQYCPRNLQQILGAVFQPVAWAMGVSWKDSFQVGNLLGTRMVLNEFVSFLQLGQIGQTLDPRSLIISTFALCGFANFSSIAIQIGGIGALAPSRRHDLSSLGLKAMIAGTIANFLSACIAGVIL
jgi:concentrative nucleoside transporter, CNT family